mgnify:CR=1 FL=1
MKILVTGANGYLGSGVVESLLKDGVEVIATDFQKENINEKATIITANLFEVENPYEYFGKPDVLLHMAWRDGFVHNSETHMKDLPKHVEFIEKMIRGGVKRVSVMGSMHEIGFFEGFTNLQLLELYGITFFMAVLAYYMHGANIARLILHEERKTYLFKKNKEA